MTAPFDALAPRIEALAASGRPLDHVLGEVCRLLKTEVPHYDWVGFYLTDPAAPRELVLGPFDGAPTEHVRIPFGTGICGQAAEREATFVIQDVRKETNYLSCSPTVRSEIVVPLMKDGRVLGELDIDSHAVAPFTPEDRAFLERVCRLLEPLFK
jgi:GAF domain-containing protein